MSQLGSFCKSSKVCVARLRVFMTRRQSKVAEGKYLKEITSDDLQYLQNITDDKSCDKDAFFDFDIADPGSPAAAAPADEEIDKSLQPANQSKTSVYFETVEPTSPAVQPVLLAPSSIRRSGSR